MLWKIYEDNNIMDLKALYLRKKFWINDFFHGGKMWSAFKEINYINNNIVEGANCKVEYVSEILVLSSGKRKVVINEWKNQ